MTKTNKTYLMIGGTLTPAFVGMLMLAGIRKQCLFDSYALLTFAGLACVGGYVTAKILKESSSQSSLNE